MIETRTYRIPRKRFSLEDLRRIASSLEDRAAALAAKDRKPQTKFSFVHTDLTTYESDSAEIFRSGGEIETKPVQLVEFRLNDFKTDTTVSLTLDSESSRNQLRVSSSERDWLGGTFTALVQRIEAAADSESWFTKHPSVTYHLFALGLGVIIVHLFQVLFFATLYGVLAFFPDSAFGQWLKGPAPDLPTVDSINDILSTPFAQLFLYWIWGTGAAYRARAWLFEAWPYIELSFGPEHQLIPPKRRKAVAFVLTGIVVPLMVAVIYDMLKYFGDVNA